MIRWESKRYRARRNMGARRWRALGITAGTLLVLALGVYQGVFWWVQSRDPAPPPAAIARGDPRLAALPLAEVASARPGDTLVVWYTGDNGWQANDIGIARALAARGYPVVAVDTLRYFHKPRTPPEAAADLSALIERYAAAWNRPHVILAGYSFGGDALALITPHLSAGTRARVTGLTLLAPGPAAELAMHPYILFNLNWPDAVALSQAIAADGLPPVSCIAGVRDDEAACTALDPKRVRLQPIPGDHFLVGQYGRIADLIAKP